MHDLLMFLGFFVVLGLGVGFVAICGAVAIRIGEWITRQR